MTAKAVDAPAKAQDLAIAEVSDSIYFTVSS